MKRKQRTYFRQCYLRQELFSTSQQEGEGWIKTLMRNSSLIYILYTFAFVSIKILILLSISKQGITFMDISERNRKLKSSQFIFQFFFFYSLTSHLLPPPTAICSNVLFPAIHTTGMEVGFKNPALSYSSTYKQIVIQMQAYKNRPQTSSSFFSQLFHQFGWTTGVTVSLKLSVVAWCYLVAVVCRSTTALFDGVTQSNWKLIAREFW